MKILLGLSGGVDSAVAAWLLKQAGHEVIGATMTIWGKDVKFNPNITKASCFGPHEEDDIKAAKNICEMLDIPYYVFDCSQEYKKVVLENFKQEYINGRTPNPCIWCNSLIKFDVLPKTAERNGLIFDKFATGHYANLKFDEFLQRYQVLKAKEHKKDQSYFLYRLTQEQLSKIMLPLGEYSKEQIRQIAKEAKLPVHNKPDSQDFYSGNVNDIIKAEEKTGNFVNTEGKILGQHNGIWNFTIGQRRGMGVSAEKPLYVIDIIPQTNEVVLGFKEEGFKNNLQADMLNWVSCTPKTGTFEAQAKIRSSQEPQNVVITVLDNNKIDVTFETPQSALTKGQSIVFYDDDLLLGGAIICNTQNI